MMDIVTFSTAVNPDDTLEEHAEKIRDGIRELQTQMCNALHLALTVGERLRLVRDQVAHGKWNQWLKDNCPIKPRTAKLYIQLADHRGVIGDKIMQDPTVSIRAVRRLIAKPIKPAAEEPGQAGGEEAEAAPPDRAADLLAMWGAASITDQKNVLAAIFDTITLTTAIKAMPKAWRDALESRARGSLQSRCTTKRERDTVRKLEKKRPYMELTATPID